MRQSRLFTKTQQEAPKDEQSKNAKLLMQAGYVFKEMAGVYSFLPLGQRVIRKINNIIHEEMTSVGGEEIHMSALQDPSVWEKSGRWSDDVVDNWFKTSLQNGTELGLGFTHEEPLTRMMAQHITSYKQLPAYPYQIQLKFRNEVRSKSGVMRGREFYMKDLYSFSENLEQHNTFYELMKKTYMNVFSRCGVGDYTYLTFADGGSFSKFSHEFQTITSAGEDTIYVSKEKNIAVNKEVLNDDVLAELGLTQEELTEEIASEVGNIFTLGTKFSEALDLTFTNREGKNKHVFMGSYGIGPARLMGVVTELYSDEKGLVWPEAIAPFSIHLISINADEEAHKLYEKINDLGIDILWDDRDLRPGQKFADSDLIGIPHRVVISPKTINAGGVELKARTSEDAEIISEEELISRLQSQ